MSVPGSELQVSAARETVGRRSDAELNRSRRELLQTAALAAAYTIVGQRTGIAQMAFPTEPRRRIAVATYPFRARLVAPRNTERVAEMPGMDLAGFARYIRKEFNVYGIEPLHAHFPSMEMDEIHKLRAAFDQAEVRVVNIPVDEEVDLCSADAGERKKAYDVYCKWVEIAVVLRSPSIRIGVPKCGGIGDIAGPVKALAPVVAYATSRGVLVNLENDDPELGTAARVTAILQAANNPGLRALPDFGNSTMSGDERFNAEAVRSMFRYAVDIAHVKDAVLYKDVQHRVGLPALFTIARAAGYRGSFSMETDSSKDPVPDTKRLIARSLALM